LQRIQVPVLICYCAFSTMSEVDKDQLGKRLKKISDIFSGMVGHADEQLLTRCPYKNRHDQCTAKFGCRNQRKPPVAGDPLMCGGDDKIDYRTAWDTDPAHVNRVRDELRGTKGRTRKRNEVSGGRVSSGKDDCPAEKGMTLFDHADVLGVKVPTSCGRSGICHECVVEVEQGMEALSKPSEAEAFLTGSYRLCCQAFVDEADKDIRFSLLERAPKILTATSQRRVEPKPAVTRRGDRVFYLDEDIDAFRGRILGLALDIGTTTVAGEFVDLETGTSIYSISFQNPQRFGGSDIMNRISYDGSAYEGELNKALINVLNDEIRDATAELGVTFHEIYELVVVGNATMRELFLNMDVQSIGQKPYKSSIEFDYLDGKIDSTAVTRLSRTLRLRANRNARVYAGPLIASHVGADVAADLISMDMDRQTDLVMMIDVGTNTEVVLGTRDRLIAASCPAGPAFEGGLVQFGMTGTEGAIESLRYVDGEWQYKTIGDVAPEGICGSGLIDLMAELRRHDLSTPKGVFAGKVSEFTIVPDAGITFSRLDSSHLAQAKAANYCGQMILMRAYGVSPDQISKLYLAGGFANYVDADSAIEIGFLAPVPAERIEKIGNAALQGAREMLVSMKKREDIDRLVKTIEHVELETTEDFFEVFTDGCQLKPMAGGW